MLSELWLWQVAVFYLHSKKILQIGVCAAAFCRSLEEIETCWENWRICKLTCALWAGNHDGDLFLIVKSPCFEVLVACFLRVYPMLYEEHHSKSPMKTLNLHYLTCLINRLDFARLNLPNMAVMYTALYLHCFRWRACVPTFSNCR